MKVERVLDEKGMEAVFQIREAVFVLEQGVDKEEEFDEYENNSQHVLLYQGELPIATGRVRIVHDIAKLERICVLAAFRKAGIGKIIMEELEAIAKSEGVNQAKLHAQTQAQGFYEKMGYHKASEEFMEAGIAHLLMVKEL
ncbi:MAG: GNAT family N-acetyltransferase [Clostridia bacterium]